MNFEPVFDFLKKLARNNNREWFEKNKAKYIAIKDSFDGFVAGLLDEMITFDNALAGLDPKKLTFRIYRDVRFSKDKTPYKKNMSAGISPTGKGMGKPGYYLHIQPGNESYVALGLFHPEPETLARIRQEIDYNGDDLLTLFNAKKFRSNFGKFWDGDTLKTAPKGYPKDHPLADWLRLKSFIIIHNFTDKEVLDKKFLKKLTAVMQSGKPLNDFLTHALV